MILNGKDLVLSNEKTISELLRELNVNRSRVVVEINKEIIAREEFDNVILTDKDVVEVISFVGGG